MQPNLSLIISVYKRVDFLKLVLVSVAGQHFRDVEVILAEDDNSASVEALVALYRKTFPFKLYHVCQEDQGFRKNKILNRAIAHARGRYLVFIDGDCILHPRFLGAYAGLARQNTVYYGRRVKISPGLTRRILSSGRIPPLFFLHLLAGKSRHIEEGLYLPFIHARDRRKIQGCNFCIARVAMERINGFDEDFTAPFFGEDTDVDRRLRLAGYQLKSSRHKAIQYHLHHTTGNRQQDWDNSRHLYTIKKQQGHYYPVNGLHK